MQRYTPFLLTVFLIGCASYADVRTSAPSVTTLVSGKADALADCYVDKRRAKYVERFQKTVLADGVHLMSEDVPLWGPPTSFYELKFVQVEPEKTRLEIRGPVSDAGAVVINILSSCVPS